MRNRAALAAAVALAMAGIQRPYLGLIETGNANPSLLKIADLANALGMSVVQLLSMPADDLLKAHHPSADLTR